MQGLRERHQERAAAAQMGLHLLGQRVEQRQDLIAGMRAAGQGGGFKPLLVQPVSTLQFR